VTLKFFYETCLIISDALQIDRSRQLFFAAEMMVNAARTGLGAAADFRDAYLREILLRKAGQGRFYNLTFSGFR
jgi:hypothetical protein